MGGFDIPWDIAVLPTGAYLVTERDRQRIIMHTASGGRRVISNGPPGIWSGGETGLMSILADPNIAKNDRFYTCNGWRNSSRAPRHPGDGVEAQQHPHSRPHRRHPARRHPDDERPSRRLPAPASAPPARCTSARVTPPWAPTRRTCHCSDGKVLKLGRLPDDPARQPVDPLGPAQRYIYNYGHRNVQGLARRADGSMWSSSTAPTVTTRSTWSSGAGTTAGTRSRATTSRPR